MNHPLTDEMILELVKHVSETTDWNNCDEYPSTLYARAAWDAGFQAVIDFLESESCSDYSGTLYYPTHGDDESIAEAIHRAMRPQEES